MALQHVLHLSDSVKILAFENKYEEAIVEKYSRNGWRTRTIRIFENLYLLLILCDITCIM